MPVHTTEVLKFFYLLKNVLEGGSPADPDPHHFGSRIRVRVKSRMRIHIKANRGMWIRIKNSGAMEAQNGAMECYRCSQWRRGGLKWSREGSVDQRSQIPIALIRSRIRIRIEVI
jgi:hypothetical protein